MFCFAKSKRLLKKRDYDYVFAQAKKMVTSEFIILYRSNSLGQARLGMALAKKVIHKAHDRNRVKRMIRETFRSRQLPAVDVIVLAKHGVIKMENSTVQARLDKAWDKLAVLCDS